MENKRSVLPGGPLVWREEDKTTNNKAVAGRGWVEHGEAGRPASGGRGTGRGGYTWAVGTGKVCLSWRPVLGALSGDLG